MIRECLPVEFTVGDKHFQEWSTTIIPDYFWRKIPFSTLATQPLESGLGSDFVNLRIMYGKKVGGSYDVPVNIWKLEEFQKKFWV